jgi:dolichyl-phosphate beta-glucosyltransferase
MQKKNQIFLTVVSPCYNEEANLKRGVLREVRNYLKEQKYSWEVIVSDDGSSDDSKKIIKKQIRNWRKFRLLENSHGGKPSALWFGIKSARGKYVLFADMDQSTPINQLSKLLSPLKEDYQVVVGSRGMQRKNFPFYRRLGAVVFSTFRKSMILPEINDTQCGFKLFDTKIVKEAFPKLEFFGNRKEAKGWTVTSYDVELLHIVKKMGVRIKEVLVKWHDEDVSQSKGGSLKRYFRESREMLGQIFRVKLNDLRGAYDV